MAFHPFLFTNTPATTPVTFTSTPVTTPATYTFTTPVRSQRGHVHVTDVVNVYVASVVTGVLVNVTGMVAGVKVNKNG